MAGLRLHMDIHPYCDKYGLATAAIKVQDLLNYTTIDPKVQRKLSAMQRKKIARYLQENDLEHIFFGPVTLSLKEVDQLTKNQSELTLKHGAKLSILDGQHRIMALEYVNDQLQKEVRKLEKELAKLTIEHRRNPADADVSEQLQSVEGTIIELEKRRLDLIETTLSVQIYIGLSEEQERQLFGDINSKIQLVNKELGQFYDNTDPLNNIIKQLAEHHVLLKAAGVEKRNSLTAFNKNFTSMTFLYSTASLLFSGEPKPSYELQRNIRKNRAFFQELLHQFYERLLPLMPKEPGLSKYSSSSRLMQESIALYTNQLMFIDGHFQENWTEGLHVFSEFDWTNENVELGNLLGRNDKGKLMLSYDRSFKKHEILVEYFHQHNGSSNKQVSNL